MKFCPEPLWETLARDDASATFFQTPAWLGIAARHFRAERAPLLFEFPDGPACLPLLRDKRWGRYRYFSPFGTYAAVLCPRILPPAEIRVIEDALAGLNVQLTSSPFTRNPVRAGEARRSVSRVFDLATIDPNDAARGWERDQRRRMRGARANGLRVRLAVTDLDWEDYDRLYRGSLGRWGRRATSEYPPALLRDIRATLEGTPAVRLWLAERDGDRDGAGLPEPGAGFVAFYHNKHAVMWHAAADAEFFKVGAVQLLYHDILADAAARGFVTLDLLGSGGLAGVEAFKASLGARALEYDSFVNRAGWIGGLAGLRERLRAG